MRDERNDNLFQAMGSVVILPAASSDHWIHKHHTRQILNTQNLGGELVRYSLNTTDRFRNPFEVFQFVAA